MQRLDDDDAETQRVDFLRRHRESLLQRQRFETVGTYSQLHDAFTPS
jgi:hypothetical protein